MPLLLALALSAPPTPAPPPKAKVAPAPAGEQAQGFGSRLFGAQLLWGGPSRQPRFGGAATQEGFGLMSGKWVNFRYQDRLTLGGQGGAFHYRVAVQVALGAIYRVWSQHGFMARLGLLLDWQRGPIYRTRWLRVPELHLGWTGTQGALHYELAATATPYVFHRAIHRPSQSKQTQHPWGVGALGALVFRRVRMNLRLDWTWLDKRPRPAGQADLCVHLVSQKPEVHLQNRHIAQRKAWFGAHEQRYRAALCANARSLFIIGPQGPVQTHQMAISITLGKISFLDPIRG